MEEILGCVEGMLSVLVHKCFGKCVGFTFYTARAILIFKDSLKEHLSQTCNG